jgi:methylmalonyl-CoA/ethylmalonyl-CoA epimerase
MTDDHERRVAPMPVALDWRALGDHAHRMAELVESGDVEASTRTRRDLAAIASRLGLTGEDPSAAGRAPSVRFDHVGIVVSDLERAVRTFADLLGARLVAGGTEAGAQVRSAFVEYPGGGKLELLQPIGPGPMADFLGKRGEGVHHFTLLVDDVEGVVQVLADAGVETTGLDISDPNWHEVYLRPRSAHGCLVQLVRPGADYGRPVESLTLQDVLADRWEWRDRRPVRRSE